MGKYLGSLVFMGCALMLMVSPASAAPSTNESSSVDSGPTVAAHRVQIPETGRHDQAAMVLIGTALIGLGAVVRRAA